MSPLVRRWIRNQEYNYRFRPPTDLINDAFIIFEYSVQGKFGGEKCYRFAYLYRSNHRCYLETIIR
jgi:hypothetical protein